MLSMRSISASASWAMGGRRAVRRSASELEIASSLVLSEAQADRRAAEARRAGLDRPARRIDRAHRDDERDRPPFVRADLARQELARGSDLRLRTGAPRGIERIDEPPSRGVELGERKERVGREVARPDRGERVVRLSQAPEVLRERRLIERPASGRKERTLAFRLGVDAIGEFSSEAKRRSDRSRRLDREREARLGTDVDTREELLRARADLRVVVQK